MNKPKKTMLVRMSAEDVADAVELWMDKNQDHSKKNLVVEKVQKTKSRKYFLTAYIK